jgi:hypothetical protein
MRLMRHGNAILVAAALFLSAKGGRADTLLLFTVSTGAVTGSSGFLDFQFGPGADSQAAFVQIENFSSDGSLNGTAQVSGPNVTGSLPGIVKIDNSTGFNDYYQPFNYGQSFSFTLDVGGPAITAPNGTSTYGTSFGLGLLDSNQNSILTNDQDGFAATVELNLDGTLTPQVFPSNSSGGAPVTTIADVAPEPGVWASAGFGLMLILARRRARRQPSQPK